MNQTPDPNSVSVVVPCYNGMPYLPESLDSAIAQTHKPIEIIVVDDGSKDDSAACVERYIREKPGANIRLIKQPNGGEPVARNTGIRAASGTWVAQLDTDDWWDPRKLELQLQTAEKAGPECVLVHTGVLGHLPDGKLNRPPLDSAAKRTGWCTMALLGDGSIGHPSIMVRRTALEKIGGYDPAFRQACDIDMYFRLSAVGTFAFVPEYLLHYRYHPKQMSASQVDQIGFHHRAVRKFFAEHPDIEAKLGRPQINAAMAAHIAVKLESLYWKRRMSEFRQLLKYAQENGLDNEAIQGWRRRARVPDWALRMKDRLTGGGKR